jgi:hypothetical protein
MSGTAWPMEFFEDDVDAALLEGKEKREKQEPEEPTASVKFRETVRGVTRV